MAASGNLTAKEREELSKKGGDFYERHEYQKAIPILKKLIELGDDSPQKLNRLGLCYVNVGDYLNAEKNFIAAIEKYPLNFEGVPKLRLRGLASYYDNLMVVLCKLGSYEEAKNMGGYGIAAIDRINGSWYDHPFHYGLFSHIAYAYLKLNDISKAKDYAMRALGLQPKGDADLYLTLSQIYLAERDIEQVHVNLDKAIALDKKDNAYSLRRAEIHAQLNMFDEALTEITQFLKANVKRQEMPDIQEGYDELKYILGKYEEEKFAYIEKEKLLEAIMLFPPDQRKFYLEQSVTVGTPLEIKFSTKRGKSETNANSGSFKGIFKELDRLGSRITRESYTRDKERSRELVREPAREPARESKRSAPAFFQPPVIDPVTRNPTTRDDLFPLDDTHKPKS